MDEKQLSAENIAMPDISEEIGYGQQQNEIEEEKSSSFPFDSVQSDVNTAMYDQSSPGVSSEQQSNDNLLATLAEDNANSLPSMCDEIALQSSSDGDARVNTTTTIKTEATNPNETNSNSSSLPAISEDLPNGKWNFIQLNNSWKLK